MRGLTWIGYSNGLGSTMKQCWCDRDGVNSEDSHGSNVMESEGEDLMWSSMFVLGSKWEKY